MEVAQIVVKPVITEEEKKRVIDKLNEIKQDVLNGSSFLVKRFCFLKIQGQVLMEGFIK